MREHLKIYTKFQKFTQALLARLRIIPCLGGMIVFTLCHARYSIIYIARNRVIRADTWQPSFMRYDA